MKISKNLNFVLGLAMAAAYVPTAQPVSRCLLAYANQNLAPLCLSTPRFMKLYENVGLALGADKVCSNFVEVATDWEAFFAANGSCVGTTLGNSLATAAVFYGGVWLTYKGLVVLKDGVYYLLSPKKAAVKIPTKLAEKIIENTSVVL